LLFIFAGIMNIQQNVSLKKLNTFGIDVLSKYFSTFENSNELTDILSFNPGLKTFVLGGGSNILFTGNFDGLILKNEIKGIDLIDEDDRHIYVKAGAGENWHNFVVECLTRNWGGVENLSLIPGNVGASPIQNIGAYGVEIKSVFYELEAYSLRDRKVYTFTVNDCEFGYRESIFKKRYKNQFIILSVTYCLSKFPTMHTEYSALKNELAKTNVQQPGIQDVARAVVRIRSSKLPDPAEIGNAGSFFKNPTVDKSKFENMKKENPNLEGYDNGPSKIKVSAGWLIEQCGWKGFRKGDAGCYSKQALVLVNYGNATGKDILELSNDIFQSVKSRFGVELEKEVNIL
jgi:UDP-N-acetylmuramate dehydrogenase